MASQVRASNVQKEKVAKEKAARMARLKLSKDQAVAKHNAELKAAEKAAPRDFVNNTEFNIFTSVGCVSPGKVVSLTPDEAKNYSVVQLIPFED